MSNETNVRAEAQQPLLSVRHLKTYFPIYGGMLSTVKGYVHAVDDISLDVYKSRTLGLVGESGCGKTTFAQTVMRIVKATDGEALFEGRHVLKMNQSELRGIRKDMQLIFQDPFSSLDPRMEIGSIIAEPLRINGVKDKDELMAKTMEMMRMVEIEEGYFHRYPHEFSGGQRQRITIARSLILHPKLIFCDEPVSALDVSIQSQSLNLLKKLQDDLNLTYVFVSHALNVVQHVSDDIAVMYLGKIMEYAPAEEVFHSARHPYTQALLSAIPIPDPKLKRDRLILQGDIPSPANPPAGCRFNNRCKYATEKCRQACPELKEIAPGHKVACFLYDEKEKAQ